MKKILIKYLHGWIESAKESKRRFNSLSKSQRIFRLFLWGFISGIILLNSLAYSAAIWVLYG